LDFAVAICYALLQAPCFLPAALLSSSVRTQSLSPAHISALMQLTLNAL
jgi:hypothetical protein